MGIGPVSRTRSFGIFSKLEDNKEPQVPVLVKELLCLKDLQSWYTIDREDDSTEGNLSLWDLIDARITWLEDALVAVMLDEQSTEQEETITK